MAFGPKGQHGVGWQGRWIDPITFGIDREQRPIQVRKLRKAKDGLGEVKPCGSPKRRRIPRIVASRGDHRRRSCGRGNSDRRPDIAEMSRRFQQDHGNHFGARQQLISFETGTSRQGQHAGLRHIGGEVQKNIGRHVFDQALDVMNDVRRQVLGQADQLFGIGGKRSIDLCAKTQRVL